MLSLILTTASLLLTFVAAQAPTTNFSTSDIINSGTADLTTRNSWCNSQFALCGTLCGGKTDSNECHGDDLKYTCTCTSNHSSPALEYYQGSLLNFECHNANAACIKTHAGDATGQKQCNNTFVCSDIKASDQTATTSSSASSSMASSTTTGSSTAGSASATAKGAAMKLGQDYGSGILAAGMLGLIGLAL